MGYCMVCVRSLPLLVVASAQSASPRPARSRGRSLLRPALVTGTRGDTEKASTGHQGSNLIGCSRQENGIYVSTLLLAVRRYCDFLLFGIWYCCIHLEVVRDTNSILWILRLPVHQVYTGTIIPPLRHYTPRAWHLARTAGIYYHRRDLLPSPAPKYLYLSNRLPIADSQRHWIGRFVKQDVN